MLAILQTYKFHYWRTLKTHFLTVHMKLMYLLGEKPSYILMFSWWIPLLVAQEVFLTSCPIAELPGKNISWLNLFSCTLQHKNISFIIDHRNVFYGFVTCLCTEQDTRSVFIKNIIFCYCITKYGGFLRDLKQK